MCCPLLTSPAPCACRPPCPLQVRHQHVNNAVLLLRQAVGRRDWWRVAALVATLLASDVRGLALGGSC